MESAAKRMLVIACLLLGACDGAGQRLQCSDPNLTAECQGLLKACGANAAAVPQTGILASTAQRVTACLKGTYAARCNPTCQLSE